MSLHKLPRASQFLALLAAITLLVSILNVGTVSTLAQASNLAQGKPVTTDSAQSSNPAANGNDGNTGTRWCAANGNTGHWWRVDLGASYNLTGSEVMWEFARNYKYRVEVSTNDSTWTTVVDKTNNTSSAQTQNDPFTTTARYVRITVTGLPTSPVTWASFFEFRVFGAGGATATPTRTNTPGGPTNTPTRTPTRTNTPTGPTATPTRTQPSGSLSIRGADVSSLQRALDQGQVYYNAGGGQQHPLDILKNIGVNYIRLRVWVNPISGYNNKAKIVAFAPQVTSRGMKLLIDLHYSDTWADPGKQYKPTAWSGHTLAQLKTDVYNHTYDVCNSLKNAGATPDMIQVGNEITPGMLWEEGRINGSNFVNVSELIKQGYNAVKACNSATQVMLHIDKGGDNGTARWWYDGVQAQGVQWDVTGLSFYCYWHGTIPTMQSNVADMKARYNKPVVIVETSYPFSTGNGDSQANVISSSTPCSGYSASLTGQASNFNAVKTAIQNGGGIGVVYWEPTWVGTPGNGWDPANINGTGSGWDNQAVFDFNFRLNPNITWN